MVKASYKGQKSEGAESNYWTILTEIYSTCWKTPTILPNYLHRITFTFNDRNFKFKFIHTHTHKLRKKKRNLIIRKLENKINSQK